VPSSLARAALFSDAVIAAAGPPRVEVVATAKRDLSVGHVVDGLGGYDTYGQADTATATAEQDLLPMGVAEGCRLLRAMSRDQVLTYATSSSARTPDRRPAPPAGEGLRLTRASAQPSSTGSFQKMRTESP
jgi:predicted homoserine dehydrogenase-like protein